MGYTRDNPVHILLNNSNDIRRHLLLGGIDSIKALERYEYFKKLKNLKKRKFLELNEKLKSIDQEVAKFHSLVPRVTEEKVEKQIVRLDVKKDMPVERGKGDSKTRDLKREIRVIQEKLARLNF